MLAHAPLGGFVRLLRRGRGGSEEDAVRRDATDISSVMTVCQTYRKHDINIEKKIEKDNDM